MLGIVFLELWNFLVLVLNILLVLLFYVYLSLKCAFTLHLIGFLIGWGLFL